MALLQPPTDGVTVRMYRQGHGDCFVLAFPREGGGDPVYMLIDCGLKPGSQKFVHNVKIGDVVQHLGAATGHRIDLAVITHEHQDHVNGIWKKNDPYFEPFQIDEAWLAWTESATDPLAVELRRRHRDQLLGLLEARRQLALAVGDENPAVSRLDSLLNFELGGARDRSDWDQVLAASDPEKSTNKQALKLIKDKASTNRGFKCLDPGGEPIEIPGTAGFRAWVLGPPRSEDLLTDEDPKGSEGFDTDGHGLSFSAGAKAAEVNSPFREEFHVLPQVALAPLPAPPAADGGSTLPGSEPFFVRHYGAHKADDEDVDEKEVATNPSWRRIDEEWLYSAESLALKLNRGINNTSLVLAIELPKSKKVLLFAGDAQRGNWISWADCEWADGDTDKTRDLLARTVLYKVGHHGSHNATLAGEEGDDYANLSWMGRGAHANEFTAMITAVNKWAMTKNNPPWRHPLPSIRTALDEKTEGRVFQTDEDEPKKPGNVSQAEWDEFMERTVCDDVYFDYTIFDEP